MMRKIIVLLILIIVIMSKNVYASNQFKNLGFNEFEVNNFIEEEYYDNKGLVGEIVEQNINYYKTTNIHGNLTTEEITEQEYLINENIDLLGTIETTYKKMTTTIVKINSYYRYKVDLEWKKMPKYRGYDIIGIGIESSKVKISSNEKFKINYCYTNGNCSSSVVHYVKQNSNGSSALFELPTSTNINKISAYLYFDIDKKNTGTIKDLTAYGDYSHNIKKISAANAKTYEIKTNGIHINSNYVEYFDEISPSIANWKGTW